MTHLFISLFINLFSRVRLWCQCLYAERKEERRESVADTADTADGRLKDTLWWNACVIEQRGPRPGLSPGEIVLIV